MLMDTRIDRGPSPSLGRNPCPPPASSPGPCGSAVHLQPQWDWSAVAARAAQVLSRLATMLARCLMDAVQRLA